MYSESLLEIGLTAFAWDFYGKLVLFITALNLHLITFIVMMLTNWWETSRSQDAGYATVTEVKRTTKDFTVMALVVLLFWFPTSYSTFKPGELVQQDSPGNIKFSSEIQIPIGWWALTNFTKAATNQIKAWIVFEPRAQTMLQVLNTMRIQDTKLQYDVNAFIDTCYHPTLRRWQVEGKTPIPKPESSRVSENPNFIGNGMFLRTPGYYKQCSQAEFDSGQCYVKHAPKMPEEVANRNKIKTTHLSTKTLDDGSTFWYFNTPSCYTWWTGRPDHYYDTSGIPSNYTPLRSALIKEAKNKFLSHPNSLKNNRLSTDEENQLIFQLLSNDDQLGLVKNDALEDMSFTEALGSGILRIIGTIGGAIMAWLISILLEILKPLLFMIQSLAIFGTILSISITTVIGGFKPQVIGKHAGFLFSLLILPIWWHFADYINEHLLRIIYPFSESGIITAVINEGIVAVIYFIFLLLAYIALPGYFVKMMAQAGAEAVDAAGDAMKYSRDAGDKGAAGASRGLRGFKK